jgi:hypothetical protein
MKPPGTNRPRCTICTYEKAGFVAEGRRARLRAIGLELSGRRILNLPGIRVPVGVEPRLLLPVAAGVHVTPSARTAPAGVEEGGATGR